MVSIDELAERICRLEAIIHGRKKTVLLENISGNRICIVEGCGKLSRGLGLCIKHYETPSILSTILGNTISDNKRCCASCGLVKSAMFIDHINGDGGIDRKRFATSAKLYRYYIRRPEEAREKLQLLCKECHDNKHKVDHSNTICRICGSNVSSYLKYMNRVQWYKFDNGGYICRGCYHKYKYRRKKPEQLDNWTKI